MHHITNPQDAIKVKTTVRYYLSSIGMAAIKIPRK